MTLVGSHLNMSTVIAGRIQPFEFDGELPRARTGDVDHAAGRVVRINGACIATRDPSIGKRYELVAREQIPSLEALEGQTT